MAEVFDIAIAGAGIAGAAAAAVLAADHKVLLLEQEEQPGYHATGRSAAMYIVSYGPSDVRALTLAGRDFFYSPPEGFSEHPLVASRGLLMVAHPGQEAKLEAELTASAGMRPIARQAAQELVPLLRPEVIAAAAYEADAQDIDVAALHQGYLRLFRSRGGILALRSPLQSAQRSKGLWRLDTPFERYQAPLLINAAGAWADILARRAGARPLGIVPKRRTAMIIEGLPGETGSAR